MGSVFRKQNSRPLPAGAEIFSKDGRSFARWRVAGRLRTASVTVGADGSPRILVSASTFIAKFRDASGIVREVSTGCREEVSARAVLADLERRSELVRSGIVTGGEDAVARHQRVPISEHFDSFKGHLEARRVTSGHLEAELRYLRRIANDCGFATLQDLLPEPVERWLTEKGKGGLGARALNAHRGALLAFARWCVETHRLGENPFRSLPRANEDSDRRRVRRALTEGELQKLLEVARNRPLKEAETVRKGPRAGEIYAKIRPHVRARLQLLGRERALIYKTLVLTGLRRGELASLTVGQVELEARVPHLALRAADEKARRGAEIPLRADLAGDIGDWLVRKLRSLQDEAKRIGEPIPVRLAPEASLFAVPPSLVKVLGRDLRAAGIPEVDDRGRVVDVHALRTTFGTHLSKGGVPLRTAQAAMRHSDPKLTANVYTDPALLDVAGALDSLPSLPLDPQDCGEALRATGTNGAEAFAAAPDAAPAPDFSGHFQSSPVTLAGCSRSEGNDSLEGARERRGQELAPLVHSGPREETGRGDRIRTCGLMLPKHAAMGPGPAPGNDLGNQAGAAAPGAAPESREPTPEASQIARVIAAWPGLPEHVRLAILALVDVTSPPPYPMGPQVSP